MGRTKAGGVEIAADTLKGDVRDALLCHVRALPKPWPQMSELEQDEAIHRANALAETLVERAVNLVAARGFDHFEVSLGKISFDKGIEGKFTAAFTTDLLEGLASRKGTTVLLVAQDSGDFLGERGKQKGAPDQAPLFDDDDGDFGADDDGEDEDEDEDEPSDEGDDLE